MAHLNLFKNGTQSALKWVHERWKREKERYDEGDRITLQFGLFFMKSNIKNIESMGLDYLPIEQIWPIFQCAFSNLLRNEARNLQWIIYCM